MGAVFFHDQNNVKAHQWVQNEGAFLSKIIGEYSLPMPELNWTMLTNQMQFFWSLIEDQKKLQRQIVEFSHELDHVLQNAETEMIKAKKIYETFVPKKLEEIKGILFSNKYAVGDGGGVEFYDLLQNPGKVYHILLSTQSYLISSAVMGLLAQHKEKEFKPHLFINDVKNEVEVINQAKKKKSETEVVVLELDLNTLLLKTHGHSKSELYSQTNGLIDLTVPYQLTKGEKVIVLSSGFLFNWKEGNPKKTVQEILTSHKNIASAELMSELFFQLKEGKESKLLMRDATVVMMEVNRHGIHKV
jgi:hypothetical protein